jgi:hypothetical protein
MALKEIEWSSGLVSSCEHCKEPWCYIKVGKFVEYLSYCKLLKWQYVPWS